MAVPLGLALRSRVPRRAPQAQLTKPQSPRVAVTGD
jgi:hypothetical protein